MNLKEIIKGKRKDEIIKVINTLTDEEIISLMYDWEGMWARDNQLEPDGDWRTWLILAGRGWGKTRTGCEWVKKRVEQGYKRIGLIAATAADARDVIVEGESGILNIFHKNEKPIYEPSKRRITFSTGAIATLYSADVPERLRGPQHDTLLMDEIAAWRYRSAYDLALFGLRIGKDPKMCIMTTPKPSAIIKELIKEKDIIITRGTTYENRANLADAFFEQIISKYEGTRLGRQELDAEILDDTPGALWDRDNIDKLKVDYAPELIRIVVAIDPAVSTNKTSNETGIIVAGVGVDGHGYILDDLTIKASPGEWAKNAIGAYYNWQADKIIAESNNGGDMVKFTLATIDKTVPVKLIHAARGKQTRAEPISALYDQGKIHHVGSLPELEDQMCTWIPGEGSSPDRVDALVWAIWELMIDGKRNIKLKAEAFKGGTGISTWRV